MANETIHMTHPDQPGVEHYWPMPTALVMHESGWLTDDDRAEEFEAALKEKLRLEKVPFKERTQASAYPSADTFPAPEEAPKVEDK